jgi:hypothetical protein
MMGQEIQPERSRETLPAPFPLEDAEDVQTPIGAGLPIMVPLSVPEIRRLFYYLVGSSPLSVRFRLAWSFFRRTHQALAHLCHCKRRLASAP